MCPRGYFASSGGYSLAGRSESLHASISKPLWQGAGNAPVGWDAVAINTGAVEGLFQVYVSCELLG